MQVTSVNVGEKETVRTGDRSVETGIRKRPVAAARVGPEGLVGDTIVNEGHHGGPDQAVYLYSTQDYDWWSSELGRDDLHPGLFGENLTVDLDDVGPLRVGDRLVIGEVVLEVTAPRIPCAKFQAVLGEPDWRRTFNAGRRHGAYTRVLEEGTIEEGMPIQYLPGDPTHPDVEELADLHLDPKADPARLEAALEAPVAERAREELERRLARRS